MTRHDPAVMTISPESVQETYDHENESSISSQWTLYPGKGWQRQMVTSPVQKSLFDFRKNSSLRFLGVLVVRIFLDYWCSYRFGKSFCSRAFFPPFFIKSCAIPIRSLSLTPFWLRMIDGGPFNRRIMIKIYSATLSSGYGEEAIGNWQKHPFTFSQGKC